MSRIRPAILILAAAHVLWLSAGPWLCDLARDIWLSGSGGPLLAIAFRFVIAPVVVLGLAVSWLTPGLLCLARRPRRIPEWILLAAPASMIVHVTIASVAKWVFGTPADPWTVKALQILVELALALGLWRNAGRPLPSSGPPEDGGRGRMATFVAAGLCVVATMLFCEQIFVRELTSDGIESLDMGASLASHQLPRSASSSGLVGLGVGMIAQAFPAYWFTTVVGATEAAPRLPLILFLPVILMGVVALAERGLPRRLGAAALAAVGTALLAGAAMLGLNASFDPYHADLSSPAALDAMTVAMMLAVLFAVVTESLGWLVVCASLAHFCRPSGLLFLLLLGAAAFLLDRGARMRRALRVVAAAVFCIALTLVYEKVYVPRVIEGGALGLESGSLLARLRYLNFTDWQRLAIVLFASGLFPWIAFFRFRRQDCESRLATLACSGLLCFFFLPASYAPHHFAPVFVLPQIPFWRAVLAQPSLGRLQAVVALGLAIVALVVVFPGRRVAEPLREVAKSISIEVPISGPLARDLLRPSAPLGSLVELPWSDADPTKELVGSPLVLAWYARTTEKGGATLFRLVPSGGPRPVGYEPIAEQNGVVLVARDRARAEAVARGGHPTDFARRLFAVPRDRLFAGRMVKAGLYDVDVKALIGR